MNLTELKVDGFKTPFGDSEDIFMMDLWGAEEGLLYLLGLKSLSLDDSANVMLIETLASERFEEPLDSDLMADVIVNLQRLQKFWYNFPHEPTNSPEYVINWALGKRIEIPWIDYAIKNKHYSPKKKSESDQPLNKRLENNYLRLIYSLCYEIPEFTESASSLDIARLIIDTTGIKLDEETIKGYIEKARLLFLSEN